MVERTSELQDELRIHYKRIIDIIYDIPFSKTDVESLKVECSKEINSKRKQSTIDNIKELITVLEERCALDCINIDPLFKIESKACSEDLKVWISCHQKLLRRFYRERSDKALIEEQENESCSSLPVIIPKPVVKLLSRDIEDSWRDFARCLNLREGEIDNIECRYLDNADRVKCVLNLFQENALYLSYKDIILTSLWKIRRNALMERVEKVFSQV